MSIVLNKNYPTVADNFKEHNCSMSNYYELLLKNAVRSQLFIETNLH